MLREQKLASHADFRFECIWKELAKILAMNAIFGDFYFYFAMLVCSHSTARFSNEMKTQKTVRSLNYSLFWCSSYSVPQFLTKRDVFQNFVSYATWSARFVMMRTLLFCTFLRNIFPSFYFGLCNKFFILTSLIYIKKGLEGEKGLCVYATSRNAFKFPLNPFHNGAKSILNTSEVEN